MENTRSIGTTLYKISLLKSNKYNVYGYGEE